MSDLESLEAVYYARPYPEWLSLTTLACVFDRLHFPGVYMPKDFDQVATYNELARLQGVSCLTLEDVQMRNALWFSLHRHHLDDFCVFTATPQTAGEVEGGTGELAHALEDEMYGPSSPGVYPHCDSQMVEECARRGLDRRAGIALLPCERLSVWMPERSSCHQ